MREHTGVVEDTTVTYVVKNLLELMRDTLQCAKRASKDAKQAGEYADQVDLEYALTHALRDVERLDQEIDALLEEKGQRLADVNKALGQSRERLQEAQKAYVTVDDLRDAREDFEEARGEHDVAAQKKHRLEEELWTAQREEARARHEMERTERTYTETRARLEDVHKKGPHSEGAREDHRKARTDHLKLKTRLELERAEIDKDYASKILDLRQQQDKIAADAKQKVQDAETKYAKAPAALTPSSGAAVIPIKAAAGK